MPWNKVVSQPLSHWMQPSGPHANIILSSRIRLARNLEGVPFPHRSSPQEADRVLQQVEAGVKEINLLGLGSKVTLYRLADASALERQVVTDKHLISPQLARGGAGRGVAISEDESMSIMVNEEDHLRIQVLLSGLQLEEAWRLASKLDDALESKLNFAFHPQHGYLTACPTNVGTGLRASVMMHLPGLVLTGKAGQMLTALSASRLVVRGLYGEGSQAAGNLFQISNQISLGPSEDETVQHLGQVAEQIVELENRAREQLRKERKEHLEDRIMRAYGTLVYARILTSDEAMGHLSDVRLGIDLGMLPQVDIRSINELLVATSPAFLQRTAGNDLQPFERDLRRAAIIRQRLAA